jgi:GGDEF domain-containing protein
MMQRIDGSIIGALGWSSSGGQQPRDFGRRRFARPAAISHAEVDVSSVFGLPDGALPVAAQQTLSALVDEVERLRHEVELAHHYETFLGEEADRHATLPVLNRRALLRDLGQLLIASQDSGLPGSVLYLHVGGIDRLRESQGLAAADAALMAIATLMRGEFRQTDLIGYLDGGDFGVVLALADADAAREKAVAVARHVGETDLVWHGARFQFTVKYGLAPFETGVSAEQLLAAADAARRLPAVERRVG